MGLDITAYKRVELVRECSLEEFNESDGETEDGQDFIYDNGYPERLAPLRTGIYSVSNVSEECHSFRAGSYGGYNHWRAELSRFALGRSAESIWAGPPAGAPFVELINFSDCEGTIGPVVSRKLAADFEAFADKIAECDEYWVRVYQDFRKAFALASECGAVRFH